MDEKLIKPFDDNELDMTFELMIRTRFFKDRGGPVKVNTTIFEPQGKRMEPEVIANILVSALTLWCQNVGVQHKDRPMTVALASRMAPIIKQLLETAEMLHTDSEIKNLMSQLDGSQNNNQEGVDKPQQAGTVFPSDAQRPDALG